MAAHGRCEWEGPKLAWEGWSKAEGFSPYLLDAEPSEQDGQIDQRAEGDGGEAVGGEEGGVETGEVLWGDDGVLVDEQGEEDDAGGDAPGVCQTGFQQKERDQQEFGQMDKLCNGHRTSAAEALRDGMQALGTVDLFVGEGVEDVETARPEEDHQHEQNDRPGQMACDGDECAGRRDGERRADTEVAEPGKTFQLFRPLAKSLHAHGKGFLRKGLSIRVLYLLVS